MKKLMALLALCALTFTGCKSVANGGPSDAQLAAQVNALTYSAANVGLTATLMADAKDAPAIMKTVTIVTAAIRADLVKFFTDPNLNNVVNSALDNLLADLSTQLNSTPYGPLLAGFIQGAVRNIEALVTLPANPGATLDARTTGAIIAGLNGLADGLDAAVKNYVPPAPVTSKRAPVHLTR
jgi:predicted small secreted protein